MKSTFRNVVATGLVSLLTGLTSCDREPTQAEAFYQSFPNQAHLLGAGNIEKYEVRGAQHCLVHIKQAHDFNPGEIPIKETQDKINHAESIIKEIKGNPEFAAELSELEGIVAKKKENLENVRTMVRSSATYVSGVQQDIYRILVDLNRSRGVDSVRNEGVARALSKDECLSDIAVRNSVLVENGYVTQAESENPLGYLMYGGAALGLGSTGTIRVKASEDEQLNRETVRKAYELSYNGRDKPDFRAKMDLLGNPREDYVLGLIDADKEPYSVVVFGGQHNFRDNIDKWNKEHPKDKFSLIVVTPVSYKEQKNE